jgi:DNA sulfur modification protein DndD
MIINQIVIENFLCYYDKNKFDLSGGLNIILGENGEGKTKFFEALDWLLNEDNSNLELLISAKAIAEADINSSFSVKVAITVNQYCETKTLQRHFNVKKIGEGQCEVSNFTIEGIEETSSGERIRVDGRILLDQIFPYQIRRYSMFKGESELDIFKNEDALINLIHLFSEAKHFEKYHAIGKFLKEKSEKAVDDSSKSDIRNQVLYKKLEAEIAVLKDKKKNKKILWENANDQVGKTEKLLQEVENHIKNAESLEIINKRIGEIERLVSLKTSSINENYTTALFDDSWLLINFESIHKDFVNKMTLLSTQKRELQTKFDREIGMKEGEKKAKAELLNNSIPLPIGVPSKSHMQEMLKDHICKVCNRPAPEDSDAYKFMLNRLEDYIRSQSPTPETETEKLELFKYDYINRLFNLSVSHEDNLANVRGIKTKIKEHFDFNTKRKAELQELEESRLVELKEREKIIGNSTFGADKLTQVLKNYNAWQSDLKTYNSTIIGYERELKDIDAELKIKMDEKESIDLKTVNAFLIKTRAIIRDISTIFKDTKEKKFDEFIESLQQKSNEYFSQMNKGAFTGSIYFKKHQHNSKTIVSIGLLEDGRPFYLPNQSLETSMHISILFGISQLTKEKHEEAFPLIFDAPTSSFGESKTGEFLNIISETDNQIILLTKDFIAKDKAENLYIKPEFNEVKRDKAFWVRLERPFDRKVLKTINTEVISL